MKLVIYSQPDYNDYREIECRGYWDYVNKQRCSMNLMPIVTISLVVAVLKQRSVYITGVFWCLSGVSAHASVIMIGSIEFM